MDINNLAKQYLQNNKNITQEQIETAYRNIGNDFEKIDRNHNVLWDPFGDDDKAIDQEEFIDLMNTALSDVASKSSSEEDYKIFFDMLNTAQTDNKISLEEYKQLTQSNREKDGQAVTTYSLWTSFVHGEPESTALNEVLSGVTLNRISEEEELEKIINNGDVDSAFEDIQAGNSTLADYGNILSHDEFLELEKRLENAEKSEANTEDTNVKTENENSDIDSIVADIVAGNSELDDYASLPHSEFMELKEKLEEKNISGSENNEIKEDIKSSVSSGHVSAFKDAFKTDDKSSFKELLSSFEGNDAALVDVLYEFNLDTANQTETGTNSFVKQLDQGFRFVNDQLIQVANALVNEAKNGNQKAIEVLCNEIHNSTAGIKNGTADSFIDQIFETADSSLLNIINQNYSQFNDGADIRDDIRGDLSGSREKDIIKKLNASLNVDTD